MQTLPFIMFLKLMREHAVHNAPRCCPQCSAEMQHIEQLSTLQEKNIIPEAESQEIMSGDNIHSLELLFLCRWQLPLLEKIYWYGIKLHTHLGHSSSHVFHKNIVKFQMSLETAGFRLQGRFGLILLN